MTIHRVYQLPARYDSAIAMEDETMILAAALLAISVHTSNPGESMDAFIVRIAPVAVAEAKARRAMVCGVIGQSDSSYSLRLKTDGEPLNCEIVMDDLESGAVSSGQTFHTHKSDPFGPARFSYDDYAAPGYLAQDNTVMHQRGRGTARIVTGR
ncbi:TPA: hypothetical protein UM674_000655 [Stenotrophomonas maltophilia]|nr:hypothetical protein [Stenotrophomonas maltophilia]